MKTSQIQYGMMVEFMEKYGDLSKPSGGPRGRHFIQEKWRDLVDILNSDGSGDSKAEEKWRKVWSDWKNNIKKKMAKITRHAGGTGGGPALQLSLTDLEKRVIQIIGVQAAVGMPVEEAGFQQDGEPITEDAVVITEAPIVEADTISDWIPPETSQAEELQEQWQPPQKKKKKEIDAASLFIESEKNARDLENERLLVKN